MTWDGLTPPYATIVADPPWSYPEGWPPGWGEQRERRPLPYSAMPVADIAELPVQDLAQPGAHLYLWTTNRYLWEARDVAFAWGFQPSEVLVWCKEPNGKGPGGVFATATEFVVYARRTIKANRQVQRAGALIRAAREAAGLTRAELGRAIHDGRQTFLAYRWEEDACLPTSRDWQRLQEVLPALRGVDRPYVEPPPPLVRNRVDRNWWVWKRGPHSAKPPAFLDLVEQVSPAPRVELFARAQRLGWDNWGWGYEGAAS